MKENKAQKLPILVFEVKSWLHLVAYWIDYTKLSHYHQ